MVSKKLTTRLAKKKNELANAEDRVKVLKAELATLNQQVQLELVKQLQTNLKTDDLTEVANFIAQVDPTQVPADDGGEQDGY